MEYKFLDLQGAKIAYLDPGPSSLRPIILLHGLGSGAASWELQIEPLIKGGFRPVAVDLPGFGRSKFNLNNWSIQSTAKILRDFTNALHLTKIDLAGISLGGVVALDFALKYQESLRTLVLINTFASLRPRSISQGYYLVKRFLKAQLFGYQSQAEDVAWRIFPKDGQEFFRKMLVDQIRQADPVVYKSAMRSLGSYNALGKLSSIQVPTIVISGENDTTVAMADQAALAQGIPGSIHSVISGGGHAIIVDQAECFNQTLIHFLQQKPDFPTAE